MVEKKIKILAKAEDNLAKQTMINSLKNSLIHLSFDKYYITILYLKILCEYNDPEIHKTVLHLLKEAGNPYIYVYVIDVFENMEGRNVKRQLKKDINKFISDKDWREEDVEFIKGRLTKI